MAATATHRESLYRNTYTMLWLVAALGLGVFTVIDRPLIAVGVYAAAVLGTFAVYHGYGGTLFDERDAEYQRRASSITLALFGWGAAIVFPALTVLYGFGYFTWEPWTSAVALLIASIYITYGVVRVLIAREH